MKKIFIVLMTVLLLAGCNKKEEATVDLKKENDEQIISSVDHQSKIDETIKEENVIEEEIDDGEIDIDLSKLTSIMAYCEVCNIISDLDNNKGKRIKIRGLLEYYEDPETKEKIFGCTVMDATACCSLGLMFVPVDDTNLPEKYSIVNVTGVLEVYEKDGYELCRLKDAVVEW